MNKKTLKIAGWALGLSMAVAGIGAAVGASFAEDTNHMVANADSCSVNISSYATTNGWGNDTKYTTVNIDGNVTATASGGGNTGKYYTSGTNWRFYQTESAELTISAAGYSIDSVTITFTVSNSGTLEYSGSAITSGEAVATSGSSVVFTVGNSNSATNGQVRITNIAVSYSVPASVDLSLKDGAESTVLSGETTTLVATPTGGLTGAYSWSSSTAGVVSFADADTNEMTFTGAKAGSTTITVALGGKTDTFVITVSRKLNGLNITNVPTKTTYEEGEDFDPTGLVVTADFLGADSEVIPNSNLVFTPSESLSSSTEEIDIAYTESGVTKHVKQAITVNAPDNTLDSISWAATDISVYSGAELTASDVEAFAVNAHWVESVPDTPINLGVYTLSIGSTPITAGDLPLTWGTVHSGKKLTASYTNNGVTKTASVDVTVVETLDSINKNVVLENQNQTFTAGTDKGDTSVTKDSITITTSTMSRDDNYRVYAGADLVIAGISGSTIKSIVINTDTSGKNTGSNLSVKSGSSGSYSYSSGVGTWTGSAQTTTLTCSTQTRINSIVVTYDKTSTSNFANLYYSAQKAALEFVDTFNTTMACDGEYGNTENVVSKWSTLSTAFTTKRTESGDADNYNNLFKYATALEGGDSLQDMLRRYDYIITKYNAPKYNYELPDFLNTSAGRAESHWALAINSPNTPNSSVNDVDNSAIVITVASISALIAGGAFLISRRRKEDR